jgi:hypothetical protein
MNDDTLRYRCIWLLIAVALVVVGACLLAGHLSAQAGAVMLGIGVVMMTAPLVWRILRFFYRLGAEMGAELRVASTPVPSPAEIAFQLQLEWGRSPTVQEVAAVQQMLSNRRNEALINSGLALGALYSMEKSSH